MRRGRSADRGEVVIWAALLLLGAPPAIQPEGAALRSSCHPEADVVQQMSGGTAVKILFAMQGELGQCIKVQAGAAAGYVKVSELTGLEEFERGKREASDRAVIQMLRSELTRMRSEAPVAPGVEGALSLLERGQPRQALEVMETLLQRSKRRDAFALAVAGVAAQQSDQPRRAVELWSESLALRPDPQVETLLRRAKKELAGDQSRQRLQNSRFLIRYDGEAVDDRVASEILDTLNVEHDRIRRAWGCVMDEQLPVIVQTREAYRASTEMEEWSGGAYDGRIRVVVQGRGFSARTRQVMAHELAHACLSRLGRFPRWFHEGMAERWAGENPTERMLSDARSVQREPSLNDPGQVGRFYAWAWWRVDQLYRRHGERSLIEALQSPAAFAGLVASLE